MSTATAANRVLVVGGPRTGKKALVSRVVGREVSGASAAWAVDTKYYTAAVEFRLCAADELKLAEPAALAEGCQGVVLLYDAADEASFAALAPWASFLDEFSPAVVLCGGVETRAPADAAAAERLHDRAREWALDAGAEHLVVPFEGGDAAGAAAEEATLDSSGEGAGLAECVGAARVAEALEANMWDEMTLKENPGRRAAPAAAAAGEKEEEDEKRAADEAKASEPTAGEAVEAAGAADGPMAPPPDLLRELLEGGDGDPAELEALTKLFHSMQAIRANANNLPDDERRRQAEKAIMSLAAMLDDGEDDDDDEE